MKFVIVLLLSVSCFAKLDLKTKDQTVKKNTETTKYQTMDLNQFNKLDSNKPVSANSIKLSTSCKTASGTEYKVGETGYDSCLREVGLNKNKDKKDVEAPSVGFSVGGSTN